MPLTLLGGYLGAGKTTIINELLARSDRAIAVLVNDVGTINVDAALIRRRNRDTIEFTDGCVCCSLSEGLGMAFDQLRSRPVPPEHVILELSGIADPDRVRPWGKSAGFLLDGVVVLIDCEQFLELHRHGVLGIALRTQVAAADLLLLTKTDLVSTATVREVQTCLDELAPNTPQITSSSTTAAAGILELGANTRAQPDAMPMVSLFDQHRVETKPIPDPIGRTDLDSLIANLPGDTLRAKGIARTPSGERLLVQVVGRRREISVLREAEAYDPTDLVVITPIGVHHDRACHEASDRFRPDSQGRC